jgi:uncharacterized protein YndB with AHSA1/START domain
MRKLITVLAWTALVVVAGFNICLLIGMKLPREHVVARSVTVHKPPVEVWRVLTDYASQPQWRPELKSVERLPARNGNEIWRENYKHGMPDTLATEQFVPPTYLVRTIADQNGPVQGSWEFNIDGAPGGSTIRITEHGFVRNPFLRFVSRYVMRYSYIDDYLRELAKKMGDANAKVS